MYSKVVVLGRLTRDPEVKTTSGGNTVAQLGLAVNRKFGEKEETVFLDVELWGKQAELAGEYLTKGRTVLVDGRLKQDSWQDKEGNKRSKLFVVGEHFTFVGNGEGVEKNKEKKVEKKDNTEDDESVPF